MQIINPNYPAPAFDMTPRDLSQVSDLIIHHSDGPPDQDPLAIDQEHRNEGWSMIGYNFLIAGNGTVYGGRPTDVVPSAAYGRNSVSIDVCLLGDFEPGTTGFESSVPAAQLQSLKDLALLLHQHYPSIVRTIGHRDVASFFPNDPGSYSTACPGQVAYGLLAQVKAYVSAHLHH